MFLMLLFTLLITTSIRSAAFAPTTHITRKTIHRNPSKVHSQLPYVSKNRLYSLTKLAASADGATEKTSEDFWAQQKELADSMKDVTEKQDRAKKVAQKEKYAQRLQGLVADTFFYSIMIFSILWVFSGPLTPISYVFGASFGTAYSYGLGRYVEAIGQSVDDSSAVAGAGVGQARFAFLIVLILLVGKFKSQGLQEIPAIMGFFTYQIASLGQGLKEYED